MLSPKDKEFLRTVEELPDELFEKDAKLYSRYPEICRTGCNVICNGMPGKILLRPAAAPWDSTMVHDRLVKIVIIMKDNDSFKAFVNADAFCTLDHVDFLAGKSDKILITNTDSNAFIDDISTYDDSDIKSLVESYNESEKAVANIELQTL